MFAACKQTRQKWISARDIAILSVLVDTRIRASELCGLTLDRVIFGDESYLRIKSKGAKWHIVQLGKF